MSEETMPLSSSQAVQRDIIIEASRELFARFGYKKTTMDDIAGAMHKGKSSLYYYFKNKEDIFTAVIDLESQLLFNKLKEIVDSGRKASEKLHDYVITRMETISKLQNYQNVLKEGIYGGYEFLEGANEKGESIESEYLKKILDEGVLNSEFHVKNTRLGAIGIVTALRGLEIPIFRGSEVTDNLNEQLENVMQILFYGVMKR